MRIQILLLVVALHVANLLPGVASQVPPSDYNWSIKKFSAKSFQAITQYETGNFVYSPVVASMPSTMMAFGARGGTARLMRAALGFPVNDTDTKNKIKAIVTDVARTVGYVTEDYELHLSYKMFYSARTELKDNFMDMSRSIFGASPRKLDFAKYNKAKKVFNRWSERKTNHRVTEVFDSWVIDEDTKVLLASVAYFKGKWKVPFESDQTRPRKFYINGATAENVETMFVAGYFRYGHLPEADATFVELPYKVPNDVTAMSMYVILPNKRDGLGKLIQKFDKIDDIMLMGANPIELNIYLPKFNYLGSIDLDKMLEKLGLLAMYNPYSDFRGIIEERPFNVKNVAQKAFIEVDEGVHPDRAIISVDFSHLMAAREFHVDHPFVCVIMNENGIPLFIAVIKDPLRDRTPDPWKLSSTRSTPVPVE